MPCNSDYLDANGWEQQISKVACLHDELDGKPHNKSHWAGFHPSVYCKGLTREQGDEMVADLCYRLQHTDVSKLSLEAQMWWRDHMEADKRRVLNDMKVAREQEDKKALLDRLTPYEKQLLGL
ncbi:hypothetical protein SCRM01_203 [Synechococcus phage S-CRM01]|uniref:hypothetical protein n=1 Tax=Synechococcus phage S-CRM01 TaxID=1026955 RepID=UPI000209E41C|nr:hypothetical protein SCRM01_203 [Synechococcus phage S-CRM01]AEC53149.1 hypothetical protein SCRM01_203 [Synechococcus phage S-CRM01]